MGVKVKKDFLSAYDAYADAIYRYCYLRVSSKEQAQDLVQETFSRMWTYVSKGGKVQNPRAFLYQTTRNLIIDLSRKKKEDRLDELLENDRIDEPSYAGDKEIEKKVLLSQIKEVLNELTKEEREMIIWRYWDDLDPKDIAALTGLAANNVSVKLHRAIESLVKVIKSQNK